MLGKRIRERRVFLEMTQDELAERLGKTREWVSKIETRGVKRPDWDDVIGLARALGEDPGEYLASAGYRVDEPSAEVKNPEQLLLAAEQILVEVRKLLRIRQAEQRPEPVRRTRRPAVKTRRPTLSRRAIRDEQKRLEDENRDESSSGGRALAPALEPVLVA